MTEQEYLELKEWLKEGIRIADDLRNQLPTTDKLIIPSFEIGPKEEPLSEEQIAKNESNQDILFKLWSQEEDNSLAAFLIKDYDTMNNQT